MFMGLATLAYIYGTVNLAAKRLHDLGMSGWHLAWIYAVSFFGTMMGMTQSTFGSIVYLITLLVSAGIGFWLLLMPGQDHDNQFGLVPD